MTRNDDEPPEQAGTASETNRWQEDSMEEDVTEANVQAALAWISTHRN